MGSKAREVVPVRLRVILIITFTNLVIVFFSVFASSLFMRQNIEEVQETNMQVVADIADSYITGEIEMLFLKASGVADNLAMTERAEWAAALESIRGTYPEFIGAAVYEVGFGRIAASGVAAATKDALENTHIAGALEGKKMLGTTYFCGDSVVFYFAVPIPLTQNHLLAITIPGTFFHEKLLDFVIWETGHVFMIDTEGTFVSNPREHWLLARNNIHNMAREGEGYADLAATASKMASGEEGIGYYTVYSDDYAVYRPKGSLVQRVCAYKPVSGSEDGWSLGAVAPLSESPLRFTNRLLMTAGAIALLLGLIAAIIGSGSIKKPFEKVEALKAEAELNSKYKSQFLANMSHDMRTPLTSVIGLTELTLRTVQLEDETRSNLVKVHRSGETLLGLINDILDISKIEAGRFELHPGKYDLPSMLNDTVAQSLLYVGEKPVRLVLDITDDLPRYMYGDELRVKQIFNNLLSNAFKFTKEGTVRFSVRCENDGDAIWMTARIEDTGIGIKAQDFEKLFTLYSQMEEGHKQHDATRRIEGTGLGLSICKRISEMMDGSITVESEYGKGSIFTVKLRQTYVDDSTIGADVVESLKKFHYSIDKFKDADKSRINLSYARVLVVDDNIANLDVAKGLMSLYGMEVDCVTGGQQAIDAVCDEKVRYSAIFMDHMMPEMDGIEATRLIREIDTEYARTVPIIALTANAAVGNEAMFLSKGFQAFLSKPIDLTQLDNALREWVRDKDAETKLTDKWVRIGESLIGEKRDFDVDIPGLDFEKGVSRYGFDEDAFLSILRTFARSTKQLLDGIKDVSVDNLPNYAITVHSIKGSSRGILAYAVGDAAEELETAAKDGDMDFVVANNPSFIQLVSGLVADIERTIEKTLGE